MDGITAAAAKEVITVLFNTDISLYCKIPYKFLEVLEQKSEEYKEKIEILENTSLMKQPISDDAKIILSLIYRDFWCSEEEKNRLNQEIVQQEKETYDPLNDVRTGTLIKEEIEEATGNEANEFSNIEATQEKTSLTVPNKWYEKIFNKIKAFFSRKKD